jgi:hypothetical protein
VLALATTRQMPSGTEWLPLVNVQPQASWIDTGERKPYSEIVWGASKLQAHELALTFCSDVLGQQPGGPFSSHVQPLSGDTGGGLRLESASLFFTCVGRGSRPVTIVRVVPRDPPRHTTAPHAYRGGPARRLGVS